MKSLVLIMIATVLSAQIKWNYDYLIKKGWSVTTICKNGFLMEIVTTKDGGRIEQQYCYDNSGWDGACNHPPVKCKHVKEK